MIIKASKRGNANNLSRHLLNGEKNEHVVVHDLKGFASDRLGEALEEIHAISMGTKCQRFLFSLSLNPPQDRYVDIKSFEDAIIRIEEQLGLKGQPRAVIFHEKEGRRHAHCVWSRIDAQRMKAIDLPFFKNRLKDISKSLYMYNGWKLPAGFIDKNNKNPLNFTRHEWQQAVRTGQNPKAIKSTLKEAWAISDDKQSLANALYERGYFLCKGDRRSYVAMDIYGEVYSLPRQMGIKKKEIEEKIGSPEEIPDINTTKELINAKLKKLFTGYLNQQRKQQRQQLAPLSNTRRAMAHKHKEDRATQQKWLQQRWQREEQSRSQKIRKGLKGFFDKLTGKYWKQRKENERETWQSHMRDQKEREDLISRQLEERQRLQIQINILQQKHQQERKTLIKDLSRIKPQATKSPQQQSKAPHQGKAQQHQHEPEP